MATAISDALKKAGVDPLEVEINIALAKWRNRGVSEARLIALVHAAYAKPDGGVHGRIENQKSGGPAAGKGAVQVSCDSQTAIGGTQPIPEGYLRSKIGTLYRAPNKPAIDLKTAKLARDNLDSIFARPLLSGGTIGGLRYDEIDGRIAWLGRQAKPFSVEARVLKMVHDHAQPASPSEQVKNIIHADDLAEMFQKAEEEQHAVA